MLLSARRVPGRSPGWRFTARSASMTSTSKISIFLNFITLAGPLDLISHKNTSRNPGINFPAHIITTSSILTRFLMANIFLMMPIFMKMSFWEVSGAKSKHYDSNHCVYVSFIQSNPKTYMSQRAVLLTCNFFRQYLSTINRWR